MSRKTKILILLLSIPIIYFIYSQYNNKNIDYIALGDEISLGINSYGIANYSYSDYIKDYINKQDMLNIYTNKLSERNKTITEQYNDILVNKKIKINNKVYNIKKLLRESDIVTISLGQNDIRHEITNTNKRFISIQDNITISKKIFKKYKDLIEEIKKYCKAEIYLIGTYHRTEQEKIISDNLNDKIKEYCNKNNINFIDISYISDDNYFDNNNSNLPNNDAYYKISEQIIDKISLKK